MFFVVRRSSESTSTPVKCFLKSRFKQFISNNNFSVVRMLLTFCFVVSTSVFYFSFRSKYLLKKRWLGK